MQHWGRLSESDKYIWMTFDQDEKLEILYPHNLPYPILGPPYFVETIEFDLKFQKEQENQ